MVPSRFILSIVLGLSFVAVQNGHTQILDTQPQAMQPMGRVEQVNATAPVGQVDSTADDSIWPKITMPKITMPKVAMPDMKKVFSPVTAGFEKVSSGSKKAWEGTKEIFTFGRNDQPQVTSTPWENPQQPKKSIWQKLIQRNPEPSVPKTVGEFMSQPRLTP